MMSYINGIDSDFYGQSEGFLQPQTYYDNMNSYGDYPIGDSSCSAESPWIGSFVTGITSEEGTRYSIQSPFIMILGVARQSQGLSPRSDPIVGPTNSRPRRPSAIAPV